MSVAKTFLLCIISAVGFVFCFLSVVHFAVFLYQSGKEGFHDRCRESQVPDHMSWIGNLLMDGCLLFLFVLQHSVMASRRWKQIIDSSGLEVLTRSLYIIATSLALQIICNCWQPLFPCSPVWKFQISPGSFSSFLVFAIHSISWVLVLAMCLTLDYAELMGVKQVYYRILGLPPPIQQKSEEHQRIFQHFRHPFSSSLLAVLWCVPVMGLDRFIMATGFTFYLLLGHSLDVDDYCYLKQQYELKEQQIWQSHM